MVSVDGDLVGFDEGDGSSGDGRSADVGCA